MISIATVNVNGLRAAVRKGFPAWVEAALPDVLALQEVRAPDDIAERIFADVARRYEAKRPGANWVTTSEACRIKGRAGVSLSTSLTLQAIRVGFDGERPDVDTGRWIEADVTTPAGHDLTVVTAYIHSGEAGTPKMDQKYAFLDRMTERLAELRTRPTVVLGDFNIAHHNEDIKNWRGNLKSAGFLPEERAYLDRWMGKEGWVDVHRRLVPEGPGPYTWWSMRGRAFDNDSGWRLDYQMATPEVADAAHKVTVDRAASYDTRWSDHAPVIVRYDL